MAVTFDGAGKRMEHAKQYTGLVLCDIDHIDDLETAFARVVSDPDATFNPLAQPFSISDEQQLITINEQQAYIAKLTGSEVDTKPAAPAPVEQDLPF